MNQRNHRFAIPFVSLCLWLAACGGNATSPSPVPQLVDGDISGSMILQTITHTVSMCGFSDPTTIIHTNLTCFVPNSCGSASIVQLTVTMKIQPDAEGNVTGTADITGTETIGVCSPRPSQNVPVSLSFPVTGSTSKVVFGGTAATMASLSNQLADFKRTGAFAGTLRDSVVSGTLSYNVDFASPSGTTFTTGSGSTTFDTTLRVHAIPR